MKIATGTTLAKVELVDGKKVVTTTDGATLGPFDEVLMAVGRKPLVEPLKLENAGVDLNDKGYVSVDEYQRTTSERNVYALGDVCGAIELTPMAIAAGRRLSDRLFGGPECANAKADYEGVPTVVFSHPTIGTIGLTEAEALEKYGEANIKVWTSTFVNLWYGPMPIDPSDTVWKSTTGLGRPDQTLKFSSSVKSKSIRLIFGRIDCSRRVLEARPKSLVQTIQLRSH